MDTVGGSRIPGILPQIPVERGTMSAGAISGAVQNILIFGGLGIVIGIVYDDVVMVANPMNLPIDALNTLKSLGLIFAAFYILFLIGIILNAIFVSYNQSPGET
jgi:hypothetical protein